jgi:hypothetical protein
MFKITKISKDATIYEHLPELNSGVDPQLELIKYRVGDVIPTQSFEFEEWPTSSSSRILVDFDISNLLEGEHYLLFHVSVMKELSNKNIPIKIHRILETWQEGYGNRNDFPYINSGVNWISSGISEWSNPYISNDFVEHTILHSDEIILIDISTLINNVITNNLEFNGLAIKYANEEDDTAKHQINLYGSDTQSIYEPTVVSYYPDELYNGSFNPEIDVDFDNLDLIVTNIKKKYNSGETVRVKVKAKYKFKHKEYQTSLIDASELALPAETLFQITDSVTGKIVVPYNIVGSKVLKTDNGYVIKFSTENVLPNRYYSIQIKLKNDNESIIYDNNLNFLIE